MYDNLVKHKEKRNIFIVIVTYHCMAIMKIFCSSLAGSTFVITFAL